MLQKMVEHPVGGHAAHDNRPFDRFPGRIHPGSGDRHDTQIDVGRQALVETNLIVTGAFASIRITEIDETQIDRALELDHALARQIDPGDMGFDQAHIGYWPGIGGRIEEHCWVERESRHSRRVSSFRAS